MNPKEIAIIAAIQEREFAVCRKTKVGAAFYSKEGRTYTGYNIENRCQKGYHAEEMAVLDAKTQDVDPKTLVGLVVTFSDNDIDNLTFCCGHCRQYVWEYTLNPDLLVTEVNPEGKIIAEVKLGDLYPYPYPRADKANINGKCDELKVMKLL